ncbi:restriction endonuclease [Verrucomicrobia bacterium]|nr:restriction endonuclease [Verrucomicrobiota bacterium]
MKHYKVGHSYRDLTKREPEDEFINWLDTDGSTIGTTGGIRTKKYLHRELSKLPVPSSIILVTSNISQQYHNPWDDSVDYNAGRIVYWGDAKFSPEDRSRNLADWRGNKALLATYDLILEQNRKIIPPLLHFTRNKSGYVQFSGLCVLDRLETTWFEDKGRPIKNLRCHLSILDVEEVPLEWIHQRARATNLSELNKDCPPVWQSYLNDQTKKLYSWMANVRSTADQLPIEGSSEAKVLDQVYQLSAEGFEKFCTGLFQELANQSSVQHRIRETRHVRDGGFDFFGRFILPEPLSYEIEFKGEAKKYKPSNGVGPKDVSRLVARLQRGEYGIFVTTSYFTDQTQKEVLQDQYPVRLFSGMDIVNFLKELRLITHGDTIKPEWLKGVIGS